MSLLTSLSLRPWRLAPVSHLFSSVAVGVLLLLAGFLYWMQSGLRPVVARLQGEQVITAYLDPATAPKDEDKIVDAIRGSLGAHADSYDVRFVAAKQFVENLKEPYPELSRELEDLGAEMETVVPRYVSVSGVLPAQALEAIKSVPGIEAAETSKDRYAQVVGAFVTLRWVAKLLIVGVCFALLTGLIHLSRMNAFMHREVLQVLRLWGGGPGILRAPSMLSGGLVGVLGGAIASLGWLSLGGTLALHVRSLSPVLRDLPRASGGLAFGIFFAGILIGLFAGALGSAASQDGSTSLIGVGGADPSTTEANARG
jgi:cell division protein FtsX